ncbi:MAG: DUF4253 domain-containing protein [Aulosira sp. ZfuVER01]|nr:DUF4253 domain-containing protein [Aulosira sp. ZfuVER01]MDZ7998112.1 DUF4253 domain-containing protein [Aulosira sp. DedVER01a]MDZ8050506.1 DUF4253 domain-containing protein [Aulosira sp. ZfuCHP01]
MVLNHSQLKATLAKNSVNSDALELLWQVDSHKIYGLRVLGSEAIQFWQQLRQLVDETEHYPLLLGNQNEVEFHLQTLQFYTHDSSTDQTLTIAEIIKQGISLNANEWLNNTAQERREEWKYFREYDKNIILDPLTLAEIGEWNELISAVDEKYTIPYDILTGLPHPSIVLALVPTISSWEVPAFLKFGNWNDCPESAIHVCLMKYWHQKYGAEVVGITNDVVEMWVNHPPKNREAAFQLAQEQYIYCYDIVDQGVQTLNKLANLLLHRKVWYFWWD